MCMYMCMYMYMYMCMYMYMYGMCAIFLGVCVENPGSSVTSYITSPLRDENNYIPLTGKQMLPKHEPQG